MEYAHELNILENRDILAKTMPCRVEKMEQVAEDVMELYLKLPPASACNFLPVNTSTS